MDANACTTNSEFLIGEGSEVELQTSEDVLVFGNIAVGSSTSQPLTLSNTGIGNMVVSVSFLF